MHPISLSTQVAPPLHPLPPAKLARDIYLYSRILPLSSFLRECDKYAYIYKHNLIDVFINAFLESFGERKLCSRKLCT
jgi:hypothetical protein